MIRRPLATALAALSAVLMTGAVSASTPSTRSGQISVAQVMSMLDQQTSNAVARQVLTAYLAGIGESISVIVPASRKSPAGTALVCRGHLGLSVDDVRRALETNVEPAARGDTSATPIIVRDMVRRAGCRLDD